MMACYYYYCLFHFHYYSLIFSLLLVCFFSSTFSILFLLFYITISLFVFIMFVIFFILDKVEVNFHIICDGSALLKDVAVFHEGCYNINSHLI